VDAGVIAGHDSGRLDLRPVAVFIVTGLGMVLAPVIEQGNAPHTLNYRTAVDTVVVSALFTAGIAGLVLLVRRPGSLTGRILLSSAALSASAGLAHAVAVRLLLVEDQRSVIALTIAWLATFLYGPAVGLLPFALAAHLIRSGRDRWLRRVTGLAAGALGLVTVAEALAPDHLTGVSPSTAIRNPLGVEILAGPVTITTQAGIAVLLAFTGCLTVVLVGRVLTVRSRPSPSMVLAGMALGSVPLVALAVRPWSGDWGWSLAALGLTSSAVVVASVRSGRHHAALLRANAALVAQREEERRRLRRELHDGLGPLLAALRLELDVGAASSGERRAPAMPRAGALLEAAMAEVRRICRDLRPADLDEAGLVGALRRQASRVTVPGAPAVSLDLPTEPVVVAAAVEVAAYRIAGEALTNAVRHSRAPSCRVRLRVDDAVRLDVVDNGSGLSSARSGTGLRSMEERAVEVGGRCTVTSEPGGGTRVSAVLPLSVP
jgi:signal transduction histidine kinase